MELCRKILCVFALLGVVSGHMEHILKYYETLKPSDISHRIVKRSALDPKSHTKQVSLNTLGRKFLLRLHSKHGLLSNDFRAVSIDSKGHERLFSVDESEFYEGYIEGEPNSDVHAYWDEEDNAMTATIKTTEDIYVIEPSWRHLPASSNHTMISYRGSDMKKTYDHQHPNGTSDESFCGFVDAGKDGAAYHVSEEDLLEFELNRKRRRKRATGTPNTCQLLLTADYKFYQNVGQKSLLKTTNYLIGLIDRVNAVYRKTDFGSGYIGYGFEVKEIRVHDEFTKPEKAGEIHYNMDNIEWKTKDLLTNFSKDSYYRSFCLAHLFTSIGFDNGVLGLAYIGSPRTYSVGGICSPAYSAGGYRLYLNTGWSSSLNRYKKRILTQEADIVTTHELGHNWGSEHDPDTDECSPSSGRGGKYIMSTYAVSGYDRNNKFFSGCSKRSMGAVLRAKAGTCFSEKKGALCGNNFVEGDEECDAGPLGLKGSDPCCDALCKLKTGATCSDKNSGCCVGCAVASKDSACFGVDSAEGQTESCEGIAKCNGINASCPTPPLKPDNTSCEEKGICKSGVCQSFCFSLGKEPCVCDGVQESCQWCCREKTVNATCKPEFENGQTINLPNGKPCLIGYCEKGVCKKQVQDLVERFWTVIENITVDKVLMFMRANIVGTIVIFSLVLWIPVGCIISYVDRKRRQEEEEEMNWLSAGNKNLVMDKDRDKIHRAEKPRHRRQVAGSVVREATPAGKQREVTPARQMDKVSSL